MLLVVLLVRARDASLHSDIHEGFVKSGIVTLGVTICHVTTLDFDVKRTLATLALALHRT